jgi:hypothetical protein
MTHDLMRVVWLSGLLVAACATSAPGAQPHEMSAEAHERAAEQHAQAGDEHNAQFRPQQALERERCAPGRPLPRAGGSVAEDVCWTSVHNPSAVHLWEAADHRHQAADHRAASADLRAAEAKACAGLDPDDRDMSPFQHTEDIVAVKPLVMSEFDARGRPPSERTLGALVTFRAVPGLSAEWLQRIVDCHLARNAALGHEVPEMPDCPLVPAGVEAHVSSAGKGFAVAVRSNNPKVAREILSRAERLRHGTPLDGKDGNP